MNHLLRITLILSLALSLASCAKRSFRKTLSMDGVIFKVHTEPNKVVIAAAGPTINEVVEAPRSSALVTGAEVADINSDGSPEVYVYMISETGHAALIAYSTNQRKSLSRIHVPELHASDHYSHASGYAGRDDFAVVEGSIVRRFPIGNGKVRQLQYKLRQGEASWQLVLDRAIEY